MNQTLAERAMQLLEDVYDLDADARDEAIRKACCSDQALQREVHLLLENTPGISIAKPDPVREDSSGVFTSRSDERFELLDEIGRGGMGCVYRANLASINEHLAKQVELLDEIGRGGMGVVYRALDRQLNREVAIKVIRNAVSDTFSVGDFSPGGFRAADAY